MTSPNVSVTVNDQSIYSEPSPQTVPLFVFATRANKITPDGSGTAPGTTESNKLRVVSSQRELLQNYGNPVFVTADGDPVNGDETNEYGLLSAHSFLGQGSRAYVIRADIDLGQLVTTDVEPVLPPPDSTYWIDEDAVVGGIFRLVGATWQAVPFSVYTTTPTSVDGVDGDWAFDYSNADGAIKFKNGGVWHVASDAELQAEYGATTNLHVSQTGPVTPDVGDFWYKTTSSAGGTNLQLTRFRAADGVWITQAIIRDTVMPVMKVLSGKTFHSSTSLVPARFMSALVLSSSHFQFLYRTMLRLVSQQLVPIGSMTTLLLSVCMLKVQITVMATSGFLLKPPPCQTRLRCRKLSPAPLLRSRTLVLSGLTSQPPTTLTTGQ